MKTITRILAGLLLLAAAGSLPANAAATTQTTHAVLCAPRAPSSAAGPRRFKAPSGTIYNLNVEGCALIAAADVASLQSQGFYPGPALFTLQQSAITASTTTTTSSITLPAYGYIVGVVLSETAGNAITGGVDIGTAGNATGIASAVTLIANKTVAVADSALTRVYVPSGVPTQTKILVACHTDCNSGSINITVLYSYF